MGTTSAPQMVGRKINNKKEGNDGRLSIHQLSVVGLNSSVAMLLLLGAPRPTTPALKVEAIISTGANARHDHRNCCLSSQVHMFAGRAH